MTRAEPGQAASHTTGVWTPLTSFVGRADDVAELTRLIEGYRLVTVTGPGGVGKTRLATEVARRVAESFPDGVWFIELGAVADGAHVAAEVASALGVRQVRGRPPLEALGSALAPRRLLIILDNCEHVLAAVADLCGVLLGSADEVRVLATSREQLGVGGETRYRLSPLELPGSGEAAAVDHSAAAALFTERARQADPRFTVSAETAPLVARVVTRLDGMPLAIELAAARVEALGLAGLAGRIDDALRLLTRTDQLAAARHRSLAAVADWSYRLLTGPEQRVFRRLAVFPGPFTLEAAEAVAGPEAGPVVLRLVDCSLLAPPRPGADERTRYTMLQTLHAFALARLSEAGEEQEAMAALAAFAWSVAEQAAGGLETCGERELGALRWLDAEDATLGRALDWAVEHDHGGALRLAAALAPWLRLRGRLTEAYEWLSAAVGRSSPTGASWARAQLWLGYVSSSSGDPADGLRCYTAVAAQHGSRKPSRELVAALATGSVVDRLNLGDVAGAVDDAGRALELARELGDRVGELQALTGRSVAAHYAGDAAGALDWARQAKDLLSPDVPGYAARWARYIVALVLTEAGELDCARHFCMTGLTSARQVDDRVFLIFLLEETAVLERLAGNLAEAGSHLREAIGIAAQIGDYVGLTNCIEQCGYLCADAGRWTDAVTLWTAYTTDRERRGMPSGAAYDGRRPEYLRRIEQQLDPARLREARDRGARMPVAAATELATMVTIAAQEESADDAARKLLSPRERELVTLVAQGHTNAEIAARLYISVRTVASHLDRIRDKTGYRRRADLTRLALEESLV